MDQQPSYSSYNELQTEATSISGERKVSRNFSFNFHLFPAIIGLFLGTMKKRDKGINEEKTKKY